MITYKNITDVEVLESVPENAMALVNDGGELKQVACKALGSGIATAIIKQDGYDNALAGIATAIATSEITYTCINMTFDEAVQIIMSGELLAVRGMGYSERTGIGSLNFDMVEYVPFNYTTPTIICRILGADNFTVYWTANGITNQEPVGSVA